MIVTDAQSVSPYVERGSGTGYDMADLWYLVRLDLERIRRHLSKEDKTTYSLEYVTQWLQAASFHPKDDGWLVRGPDLGEVDPAEVTSIEEWRGETPA
jgi:hypothetical protein